MTPFAFYGTLMEGGRLAAALPAGWYGDVCKIPGQLYNLGSFLALTLEPGEVVGQLWTPADERLALNVVDQIEGEGILYRRQRIRLTEPQVYAWVYVWLQHGRTARRIESGNWWLEVIA